MAPVKAAGKYRQEGKTYVGSFTPAGATVANLVLLQVVQDGDIIHFQFSKLIPIFTDALVFGHVTSLKSNKS